MVQRAVHATSPPWRSTARRWSSVSSELPEPMALCDRIRVLLQLDASRQRSIAEQLDQGGRSPQHQRLPRIGLFVGIASRWPHSSSSAFIGSFGAGAALRHGVDEFLTGSFLATLRPTRFRRSPMPMRNVLLRADRHGIDLSVRSVLALGLAVLAIALVDGALPQAPARWCCPRPRPGRRPDRQLGQAVRWAVPSFHRHGRHAGARARGAACP